MNVDSYLDQYEFTCTLCAATWRDTYEVRHVEDEQGGVWDSYSLSGMPVAAPAARTVCRSCRQPTAHFRRADRRRAPDQASSRTSRVGMAESSEDAGPQGSVLPTQNPGGPSGDDTMP